MVDKDLKDLIVNLRNERYSYPEIGNTLGIHPERARAIYRRSKEKVAEGATEKTETYSPSKNKLKITHISKRIMTLDELVDALDVDLDEWEISKFKVHKGEIGRRHEIKSLEFEEGKITGSIKDSGTIHVEPLFNLSLWLTRKHPVAISPVVSPIKIKLKPARHSLTRKPQRNLKVALIVPDMQFGFRKDITDGSLDPFHDRKALDLALSMAMILEPDTIVFLGDILDLPDWTDRFMRSPEFYWTTQSSVVEATWWLGQFRSSCPRSSMYVLEGNHDQRMENLLIKHMISAYQLKPADKLEHPPALSIENLLALDSLDIEYIGDYPNGKVWLNEGIICTHGSTARANPGGTTSALVRNINISEIHGHIHRREWASKTVRGRHGTRTIDAFSPGCLCRIDGAVPAKKSENNWQQGFAVVHYDDFTRYSISPYAIENSTTIIDGELYEGKDRLKQIEQDTGWKLA